MRNRRLAIASGTRRLPCRRKGFARQARRLPQRAATHPKCVGPRSRNRSRGGSIIRAIAIRTEIIPSMRYLVLTFLCAIAIISYIQRTGINAVKHLVCSDIGINTEQFGAVGTAWLVGYA